MLENKTVFLNGQYLPLNEANISVLDRGFLFGDGIYEVIPSYLGQLFHFKAHFERLEAASGGGDCRTGRFMDQFQAAGLAGIAGSAGVAGRYFAGGENACAWFCLFTGAFSPGPFFRLAFTLP